MSRAAAWRSLLETDLMYSKYTQVTNHRISSTVVSSFDGAMRSFFHLPLAEKLLVKRTSENSVRPKKKHAGLNLNIR